MKLLFTLFLCLLLGTIQSYAGPNGSGNTHSDTTLPDGVVVPDGASTIISGVPLADSSIYSILTVAARRSNSSSVAYDKIRLFRLVNANSDKFLINAQGGIWSSYLNDNTGQDKYLGVNNGTFKLLPAVTGGTTQSDRVSVLDYGADPTGTNNSATAFTNAIATGKNVFIPAGTYLINGTSGATVLQLQDGQSIFGEGSKSIIRTTNDIRVLALGTGSVVRDLRFMGTATKSTSVPGQNDIYATNKLKWLVERCEFLNLGTAIQVSQLNSTYSEGGRISNCLLDANFTGIALAARAEYVVLSNLKVHNNGTGILMAAGNCSITGSDILGNTTGLRMITGANNAHSVVSSTMINHNTTNLDISDVTTGHTFTGVMLYGGNISIANSIGIKFIGCDFFVGSISLTNNSKLLISSSRFPKAPTANAMTVSVASGENFIEANNLDF